MVLAGTEIVVVASNAGAAATPVGTLAFKAAAGTTTLAVSPQHVGDLLALVVKVDSSTVTATSVSGGGVSTWTRAEGPYTGYAGHDLEIWMGPVSTTGASTITVGYSGTVTSVYTGLASQEFSAAGSTPVWTVDTGGGISNASSTTTTFPKLTPSGSGELYFGYAAVVNTASAGSTSGFTYATTSDGDVSTYDTSVSAAVQPTAKQSPAGLSGAVAVLITASSTTSSTPTVTGLSPTSGPTAGGTSVTITGTNFTGVTAVKFGTAVGHPRHRELGHVDHRAGPGRLGGHRRRDGHRRRGHERHEQRRPVHLHDSRPRRDHHGRGVAGLQGGQRHHHPGRDPAARRRPAGPGRQSRLVDRHRRRRCRAEGSGTWTRAEGPYTGYSRTRPRDLDRHGGHDRGLHRHGGLLGQRHRRLHGAGRRRSSRSSGSSPAVGDSTSEAGISNASSTTTTFPKLTPSGTGELYFGYAAVANTASAGTTSGFTYAATSDGDVATYDTSVSAAVQPTAKQSPAGVSGAVAVLLAAATGVRPLPRSRG